MLFDEYAKSYTAVKAVIDAEKSPKQKSGEIGDVDGDGVITVADALAILRVAVKIVD